MAKGTVLLFISVLLATCMTPAPTTPVRTEPEPFIFGEVHVLRSTELGQDRTLNIHLPDGYHDTTATYPVIYVLDGSANEDFTHIAGLVQFMNMYGLLPQSIVVGVANDGRSRYRDFTSPTTNDSDKVWVPTHGGSAAFISFLEKEMLPFIDSTYRTSAHRTIIGQSLGGLLGMEILVDHTALFDDYVLVSPSLWWDNGSLATRAVAWLKEHPTSPKRVHIAVAPDDAMMREEIDRVVLALRTYAKPPFAWWYVPFPEESHMTILHRAVYNAFESMGKDDPGDGQ